MAKKKEPKFGEGDIIECPGDGEYGSVERYLIYGYLPESSDYVARYVALKVFDATECGTGVDECTVAPDEVGERYLEQFGKKIGFVDLSIFMDGAD